MNEQEIQKEIETHPVCLECYRLGKEETKEKIKEYIIKRYSELNACPMNKGKDKFCEKCEIIKSELALLETRLKK